MSVKVFFNNSCNICKLEIDHYKKISNNISEWIDITNNDEALRITSKTQKELLRRIHVINNGEVVGGAKAFLIIWSNIPKYNFLFKLLSSKPLFVIFHYTYEIVAFFLYLKNKHQLKWENKIYPQKYVLYAKGLFFGEKNGGLTGKMSFIVQKNAQVLIKKIIDLGLNNATKDKIISLK